MDPRTEQAFAARSALAGGSYGASKQYPGVVTSRVRIKAQVGYSGTGRLLHRVGQSSACAMWDRTAQPKVLTVWQCGAECRNAQFGMPDAERTLCRRCDFRGVNASGAVVYFAERQGLIKIGCSTNAMKRVAGLGATLLAIQSGGYAEESDLHQRFGDSRVSRQTEWFRPSPALLAYIADLTSNAIPVPAVEDVA